MEGRPNTKTQQPTQLPDPPSPDSHAQFCLPSLASLAHLASLQGDWRGRVRLREEGKKGVIENRKCMFEWWRQGTYAGSKDHPRVPWQAEFPRGPRPPRGQFRQGRAPGQPWAMAKRLKNVLEKTFQNVHVGFRDGCILFFSYTCKHVF